MSSFKKKLSPPCSKAEAVQRTGALAKLRNGGWFKKAASRHLAFSNISCNINKRTLDLKETKQSESGDCVVVGYNF